MTQVTPIRGFTNTPVTKAICIYLTVLTLLLLLFLLKHYAKLTIDPLIVQYSQYWRIATFQAAVLNELDYLLCVLLWFHFKTLERFFGSRKYFSLIVVLAAYNALVMFLVLSLGQLLVNSLHAVVSALWLREKFALVYYDTIFNSVAPGPFGLLSLLYMCFGAYIPVSYHFKILLRKPDPENETGGAEITLTNHFQVHAIYTLLMLNNGISSLLPCLVGLAVGRLYTQELLAGSKNFAAPELIFRLFVSPRKVQLSALRNVRHMARGYQPISRLVELSPTPVETRQDEEEGEVAIDDIRSNEPEARSETPVRPLGRQLLDAFRT